MSLERHPSIACLLLVLTTAGCDALLPPRPPAPPKTAAPSPAHDLVERPPDQLVEGKILLGSPSLTAGITGDVKSVAGDKRNLVGKVEVKADPADCGSVFDPVGIRQFSAACDVSRRALAAAAIKYTLVPAPAGTKTTVSVGGTVLGSNVQDADINNALATGTSVTLRAGTVPSDGGDIFFGNGVDITYAGGGALAFRADANGGIGGTNFGIGATAGSLSMAFNADASNLNNGFAGIGFSNATLASNGADILFYGQSDTAAGFASNYATGVGLANSTISTAGGNVLIRGSSTGADASADDAGVVLDNTSIDAGAGGVSIHGTGADVTSGVILSFSNIAAGSGGALIDGQAIAADGVYANGSDISTSGGDISVTGIGGARGVYLDGALYSAGGDIVVHGEGGTGNGLDLSGPVDSAGGDIAMYGASTDATGLEFGGGYYDGIVSAGGDISLTGHGATGGVALYQSNGSGPIVLFAPADVDTINSAGGDITITGTASAADAIGVYSYGVDLIGGAGDVTVDGSSPLGVGILLANGAGIEMNAAEARFWHYAKDRIIVAARRNGQGNGHFSALCGLTTGMPFTVPSWLRLKHCPRHQNCGSSVKRMPGALQWHFTRSRHMRCACALSSRLPQPEFRLMMTRWSACWSWSTLTGSRRLWRWTRARW